MRHRKYTFKIGRTGAHRRTLLANQVCSLICSGEIRTTVPKAKETRRLAEKMVSFGKQGDLHHRRLAISRLRNKDAVKILFSEIAPKYAERHGGYTRIIRLGKRIGDSAELCILQWVEESLPDKTSSTASKKESKKTKAGPGKKASKQKAPAIQEPEKAKKVEKQVKKSKTENLPAQEESAVQTDQKKPEEKEKSETADSSGKDKETAA